MDSQNTEPLTLKLFNYNCPLDTIETHLAKGSKTLANELALTSTLFSYRVKEPKTLGDEPVFTLFLHPVEDEGLADKLSLTTDTKPTASTKRLGYKVEKDYFQRSAVSF
jgi:hypothetical protein